MQDTWPAVPFREWKPERGAVPPLVSMFRHRDMCWCKALPSGWADPWPAQQSVPQCSASSCLTMPSTPTASALWGPDLKRWPVPQSEPKHAPWAQQFWSGSSLCWAELRQGRLSQIHLHCGGTGARCPQNGGCAGLEKGQPLPPEEWGGEEQEVWGLGSPVGFDLPLPILTRNR